MFHHVIIDPSYLENKKSRVDKSLYCISKNIMLPHTDDPIITLKKNLGNKM